jgi:hypothetical protein
VTYPGWRERYRDEDSKKRKIREEKARIFEG